MSTIDVTSTRYEVVSPFPKLFHESKNTTRLSSITGRLIWRKSLRRQLWLLVLQWNKLLLPSETGAYLHVTQYSTKIRCQHPLSSTNNKTSHVHQIVTSTLEYLACGEIICFWSILTRRRTGSKYNIVSFLLPAAENGSSRQKWIESTLP
jgi:hypothetical protein